ncbi:alpha/beta fold hydrolase [Nocardiopsis chromatogenes]|uniref:alpha/beta fold hydrolase n=1 Tax=Nocardiopsis chromatogenes TaxID=280239 RepID=UPI00034807C7|nr:alpha/beta fold hydrolase [Nocardiopsis chromatogenes]
MPYATAPDQARIHYDVRGSGEPLLLLAGQANDHTWWDGVRPALGAGFRTIATDHVGTGASDAPREAEYSTRRFAADAVAVLDGLGVERAHVYGTSMGGKIAQWIAADHPERVGALVLGCTSPGGPNAVNASSAIARALGSPDREAARRTLIGLMFTPEWAEREPGPYRVLGDPSMEPHARRAHLAASRAHDAWDALPSISAPTLVLHGTDDAFAPAANARLIADRIPGARLHLVEGARHAYFEERAEEANEAVMDHLRRHRLHAAARTAPLGGS